MDGRFHVVIPCALSWFRDAGDKFFAVKIEHCPLFAAAVDALRNETTSISEIKDRTNVEVVKRGGLVDNNLAICCHSKGRCEYCHSVQNNELICNSGPQL